MNSDDALKKLIEGNQRYVERTSNSKDLVLTISNSQMASAQKPFAIILGCSDSRVPAELVFHRGVGDLFVIRVAGNIVAPSQIGSIEFACQQFGTELVVVMGHSQCGAVSATVDALLGDPDDISPNVKSIVDRVTPAVHSIVESGDFADHDQLLNHATHANIAQSVSDLQLRSQILRGLVSKQKLKIIGAHYEITTGKVEFHLD